MTTERAPWFDERLDPSLSLIALLLSVSALLVGCSHTPQSRSVVGPDGMHMLHVSCAGDQGACFELAGQRCPYGYDLSPIFDQRDNNFLVRCRAPNSVASQLPVPQDAPVYPPAAAPAQVAAPTWGAPPSPVLPGQGTLATATARAAFPPEGSAAADGQPDFGY